jgi:hypothetical protein
MSLEEIEKRIEELDTILEKKENDWWDKKRKNMTDDIFVNDWDEYCEFRKPEIDEIRKLNSEKRLMMIPEFSEPMTCLKESKMLGDLFTLEDFIKNCECGGFIDYDGSGSYSKEIDGKLMESNISIYPSDIKFKSIRKDFTHVIWYNR